jgi:hypothetical protein
MSLWYFKEDNPVKSGPPAILAITYTQISILAILCGEHLEMVLHQMLHLNFMKCTLTYFLKLCYLT